MTTRRDFVRSVTAAVMATPLAGPLGQLGDSATRSLAALGTGSLGPLGVQLYTVRDAMRADVEGTLARVRNIGYRQVEFAGYFGRTPQQLKAALGNDGLTAPSCHVGLEAVTTKLSETLDAAAEIGHRWVVFPGLDEADHRPARYDEMADQLNAAGEVASRMGIRMGYHTHDVDLHPWSDGLIPLERLMGRIDPRLVDIELDLYWVTKGGSDPKWWLDRFPGRFPLVHVKDAGPAPAFHMEDVGAGAMDWRGIFALREQGGIKHYFVEHDEPAEPWASITASYRYLSRLSV